MSEKDSLLEPNLKFIFPNLDDPLLAELRQKSGIELAPDASEFEQVKTIIGYAHSLFAHNGNNNPPANDPLTILTEAQAGRSFRCVEYSLLANGLLWAHGIQSRVIGLKTSDVETREYGAGHVVIEFWSTEHNKWVMSDVQAGIIPLAEDTPLAAFELGQKTREAASFDCIQVDHSHFEQSKDFSTPESYADWIREYLYFIDTPLKPIFGDVDMAQQQIAMLVPNGVVPPKLFENLFVMNAIYTTNVHDFYQLPPL